MNIESGQAVISHILQLFMSSVDIIEDMESLKLIIPSMLNLIYRIYTNTQFADTEVKIQSVDLVE